MYDTNASSLEFVLYYTSKGSINARKKKKVLLMNQTFDINSGRETKLLVHMVLTKKISCSILEYRGFIIPLLTVTMGIRFFLFFLFYILNEQLFYINHVTLQHLKNK
jgi:hypothetical protein